MERTHTLANMGRGSKKLQRLKKRAEKRLGRELRGQTGWCFIGLPITPGLGNNTVNNAKTNRRERVRAGNLIPYVWMREKSVS